MENIAVFIWKNMKKNLGKLLYEIKVHETDKNVTWYRGEMESLPDQDLDVLHETSEESSEDDDLQPEEDEESEKQPVEIPIRFNSAGKTETRTSGRVKKQQNQKNNKDSHYNLHLENKQTVAKLEPSSDFDQANEEVIEQSVTEDGDFWDRYSHQAAPAQILVSVPAQPSVQKQLRTVNVPRDGVHEAVEVSTLVFDPLSGFEADKHIFKLEGIE